MDQIITRVLTLYALQKSGFWTLIKTVCYQIGLPYSDFHYDHAKRGCAILANNLLGAYTIIVPFYFNSVDLQVAAFEICTHGLLVIICCVYNFPDQITSVLIFCVR